MTTSLVFDVTFNTLGPSRIETVNALLKSRVQKQQTEHYSKVQSVSLVILEGSVLAL
jgi:hypothetical protein